MCAFEFSASNKATKPLQSLLLSQTGTFSNDIQDEQFSIKSEIYCLKSSMSSSHTATLLDGASNTLKTSVELASEKGASNWLTVLPLQEHNFTLHKTAFHDAVALRYGWDPVRLPQYSACEKKIQLNMLLLVPRMAFHQFVTMRFVI